MILDLFIALVTTDKWFMYFFKMNDGVVIFWTQILWTILMSVNVRQKRYRSFLNHYEMKTRRKSKKSSKLDFKTSQKNHDFLTYWFLPDWSLQWNVLRDFECFYFVDLVLHPLEVVMIVHMRQKRCESLNKIFNVSNRCNEKT